MQTTKKKEKRKINVIYQFEEGEATSEEREEFAAQFIFKLMEWERGRLQQCATT